MQSIVLLPIVPVDSDLITGIAGEVESSIGRPVHFNGQLSVDPSPAFDADRSQYNSTLLLASLLKLPQRHEAKIIGITAVDLFVPVLTYVFGEAQLDGIAAVVSSFRLENSFYGLPPDRGLLRERLLKEVVHELGHTFGLVHCRDYQCVMHSSTSVDEIDLKTALYCQNCKQTFIP